MPARISSVFARAATCALSPNGIPCSGPSTLLALHRQEHPYSAASEVCVSSINVDAGRVSSVAARHGEGRATTCERVQHVTRTPMIFDVDQLEPATRVARPLGQLTGNVPLQCGQITMPA